MYVRYRYYYYYCTVVSEYDSVETHVANRTQATQAPHMCMGISYRKRGWS